MSLADHRRWKEDDLRILEKEIADSIDSIEEKTSETELLKEKWSKLKNEIRMLEEME